MHGLYVQRRVYSCCSCLLLMKLLMLGPAMSTACAAL
jgi:hypothetical protein